MELPAIIEYVRFRSPEGFVILSASLNVYSDKYNVSMEDVISEKIKGQKYDTFTVTTTIADPDEKLEGRQFIFIGDFKVHPKYGDQFQADFYYQDTPSTEEGLKSYLMSLPNIQEARSSDIIELFGVEGTIEVLDNDPHRLTEIRGLNEARIPPIKEQWDKDKVLRDLCIWLGEHGVDFKLGRKAFTLWGHETRSILQENPYRMTEIHGIGFAQADKIAHSIMDSIPLEYRLKACIQYVLNEDVKKNSNLCSEFPTMRKEVISKLCDSDDSLGNDSDVLKYRQTIVPVIKANLDCFTPVKEKTANATSYLYLREIWEKEKAVAHFLHERSRYTEMKAEWSEQNIDMAEDDIQKLTGRNITLDDKQKEAVKSAFKSKITVLTGGGGTGKSTICRCIYYLAIEQGLSVRMMSPTGKAAQVLKDKTKGPASTIHRSLKMMPGEDCGRVDIEEDIIIIDEVSMVGIDTIYPVLRAMEENLWCNIVFVGDTNQLPSVSPGNFLSDLIASGCANVIKLDKIHRQSENSYISYMANEISIGKVMDVPEDAVDVRWRSVSPDQYESMIERVIVNFMKDHEIEDLQILAPMKKGRCGVYKTNEIIQKMMAKINKTEDKFYKSGFHLLHVGDKIIQTKNNYDKMIFNGDMGVVTEVGRKAIDPSKSDKKEDYVEVDFYGDHMRFIGEEIAQLNLSWCVTIHKFQGSQSPYVILILPYEAQYMMNKELVYTAFTRAEKFLALYGSIDMLRKAPMYSAIRKRHTNMNKIIEEIRSNRSLLKVIEIA